MVSKNVLVIQVSGLDLTLLVVVATVQNRSTPLSQEAFGHALDTDLGLLALRIEQNDLADTARS